jgi:adenylate cyclase
VGDAVMAVFGAPVADAEHAWHAVQSARDMDRALEALNRRWEAAGLPRLSPFTVGLHNAYSWALVAMVAFAVATGFGRTE